MLHDLSPISRRYGALVCTLSKGRRAGQWAISVNGRWRICFEFKLGDVYNVEVTDYHEG
jgi:plasmid maintenance system killer protein